MKNFLVILICISLIGCAGISEYYVSQPMDVGRGSAYKFWGDNEIVVFDLEDIKLYLQVQNLFNVAYGEMLLFPISIMGERKEITKRYRQSTYLFKEDASSISDVVKGDYFYIEILMRTKKDSFLFNPKEIYLELEDGKYLQASKYLIPNGALGRPFKVSGYHLLRTAEHSWKKERNEQSVSKYFKIHPKEYVGFAIRFESAVPNPGTPFNIKIKGLKRFDNIVPIPKIRYKDKKLYRNYRVS